MRIYFRKGRLQTSEVSKTSEVFVKGRKAYHDGKILIKAGYGKNVRELSG